MRSNITNCQPVGSLHRYTPSKKSASSAEIYQAAISVQSSANGTRRMLENLVKERQMSKISLAEKVHSTIGDIRRVFIGAASGSYIGLCYGNEYIALGAAVGIILGLIASKKA